MQLAFYTKTQIRCMQAHSIYSATRRHVMQIKSWLHRIRVVTLRVQILKFQVQVRDRQNVDSSATRVICGLKIIG